MARTYKFTKEDFYRIVAGSNQGDVSIQHIGKHGGAWVVSYTHRYLSSLEHKEVAQYRVAIFRDVEGCLRCCADVIAS